MNVLVIPSWYPSKSSPNNGSFFREQTEALKKAGVDVTVLCIEVLGLRQKPDFSLFKKNKYIEDEIEVLRFVVKIPLLWRFPKLYYMVLRFFSNKIFQKEFCKENFDCIHAHSFLNGGYIADCISKKFNIPYIVTEHRSKILKNQLSNYEKDILKICVKNSKHYICVSENLKNHVEEMTGIKEKITVHPNLVSNMFFSTETKTETPFAFVSIGNLIPLKKMDLLIQGFIKAFKNEDKIELKIIGDGIEKETLQKLVHDNNRGDQITLLGLLSREEVAQHLSTSHVMALVSETETFGVAYIEALASGNIIIGANNGGANDIVTKDNGVLIEDYSVDAVEEALQLVYRDYVKYDLGTIMKSCKEKYSEESFSENYKKYFAI